MVARCTGRDLSRPSVNEWHPDTPLEQVLLETAKSAGAVEKGSVHPPVKGGTIITGEHNQGVFVQSQFLEAGQHDPNLAIKKTDHSVVEDRKCAGEGKSVYVRVDRGGCR